MKKVLIILLFVFIPFFVHSQKKVDIVPDNILNITIDGGFGTFIGEFSAHLISDGAYIFTPVLDLYLSLFFIKYIGMQVLLSSSCIIHPNSQPIEGTIFHMGIEFFGQYDWKRIFIKLFTGAGFQHTTMLISWYASAFFEVGMSLGINITKWLYLVFSTKYRTSFLKSIIIYQKYSSINNNDDLMSLTVSFGFGVKIKNGFKKGNK